MPLNVFGRTIQLRWLCCSAGDGNNDDGGSDGYSCFSTHFQ